VRDLQAAEERIVSTRTKISYNVVVQMPEGTLSETYINEDGSQESYQIGGRRNFSAGFPTPETAAETLDRARAYVREYTDDGCVWLERVTETITTEILEGGYLPLLIGPKNGQRTIDLRRNAS
jgi:hypothetical protein